MTVQNKNEYRQVINSISLVWHRSIISYFSIESRHTRSPRFQNRMYEYISTRRTKIVPNQLDSINQNEYRQVINGISLVWHRLIISCISIESRQNSSPRFKNKMYENNSFRQTQIAPNQLDSTRQNEYRQVSISLVWHRCIIYYFSIESRQTSSPRFQNRMYGIDSIRQTQILPN